MLACSRFQVKALSMHFKTHKSTCHFNYRKWSDKEG